MTRLNLPFLSYALWTSVFMLASGTNVAHTQMLSSSSQKNGYVEVPASSIHRPEDVGKRAHTQLLIWHETNPVFVKRSAVDSRGATPLVANTSPFASAETPSSIACIYQMVSQVSGCPIATTTALPSGGVGSIAIVDAYDDPSAASDLGIFSSYYGLSTPNFKVVYASGTQPAQDPTGDWEFEESLDIEWAHAMSPASKIYLVEAASNSNSDLLAAESVASGLVEADGGGVVSNSFGQTDFSGDTSYDSYFNTSGVAYFASTGDCEFCVEWPSVSQSVIAVGGTSINRDGSGNFTGESFWTGGGGGLSSYVTRPSYQNTISGIVGSDRGVPDMVAVADPSTGVSIYDSFPYEGTALGWSQAGGTSVASPVLAARANALRIYDSSASLLGYVYGEYQWSKAYPANFRDITAGTSSCVTGWDICSGIGSPIGTHWGNGNISLIQTTQRNPDHSYEAIQVTTSSPHGFSAGSNIIIYGTGNSAFDSTWQVNTVLSPTVFTISAFSESNQVEGIGSAVLQ